MIPLPQDLSKNPRVIPVYLHLWQREHAKKQWEDLEEIVTIPPCAQEIIRLHRLSEELSEVFRVIDWYDISHSAQSNVKEELGLARTIRSMFDQKDQTLRAYFQHEGEEYQALPAQELPIPIFQQQEETFGRVIEMAHLYNEHEKEKLEKIKEDVRSRVQYLKTRPTAIKELEEKVYHSLQDAKIGFYCPPTTETETAQHERLRQQKKNVQRIARFAEKHQTLWCPEAQELVLDINEEFDTESRGFEERLVAQQKRYIQRIGSAVVGFVAAVGISFSILRNYSTSISAADLKTAPTRETTAPIQAVAYNKQQIQPSNQAAPFSKQRTEPNDIPLAALRSAELHTADQLFIYVNKEANETRAYQRSGSGLRKLCTMQSTDGQSQGQKGREWDNRTEEGDFSVIDILEGDLGDLYGSVMIRTRTSYPGSGICGTDLSERQAAIVERRDITNGGIVLLNHDAQNLASLVKDVNGRARVIVESPERPLYR